MFYTVVLDYDGGTFVFQADALSPQNAMEAFVLNFDWDLLGKGFREEAQKGTWGPPTPLAGLRSVWCFSANLRGELALANVIETVRRLPKKGEWSTGKTRKI